MNTQKTIAGLRTDTANITAALKLPTPRLALCNEGRFKERSLPLQSYGSASATATIQLDHFIYTIHDALRICSQLRQLGYMCYIIPRANAPHYSIHVVKGARGQTTQGLRILVSPKVITLPHYPELASITSGKQYRSVCTRALRAYSTHKVHIREGSVSGDELQRRNLMLYLLAEQLYEMRNTVDDAYAPVRKSYEYKFQFDEEALLEMVNELHGELRKAAVDRNRISEPTVTAMISPQMLPPTPQPEACAVPA